MLSRVSSCVPKVTPLTERNQLFDALTKCGFGPEVEWLKEYGRGRARGPRTATSGRHLGWQQHLQALGEVFRMMDPSAFEELRGALKANPQIGSQVLQQLHFI